MTFADLAPIDRGRVLRRYERLVQHRAHALDTPGGNERWHRWYRIGLALEGYITGDPRNGAVLSRLAYERGPLPPLEEPE